MITSPSHALLRALFAMLVPLFLIHGNALAQNASSGVNKKYWIKIDQSITYNIDTAGVFIKRICAANSVVYNSGTKYFEVLTYRSLNRNLIEGKLFKHSMPMADYIYYGEENNATVPGTKPQ